jgi:replication-associated recombination protein RarA
MHLSDLAKMIEKYTPKTIHDFLYSCPHSKNMIANIVSGAYAFPMSGKSGIILHGVYGTGKTALAKMLPYAIEERLSDRDPFARFEAIKPGNKGADLMVKIDNQTDLNPFASNHYIILDEFDLLSDVAMSSLKSIMNKPETIFIMTTNNISKIDKGVINRSILVDCNAAPDTDWLVRTKQMLADFGLQIDDDELLLDIIRPCNGAARDIMFATQKLIVGLKQKAA